MSIYYFIALLSTALGLFLLFLSIYSFTATIVRTQRASVSGPQLVSLFIAILLTVWGIDMLVHLDQF